MVAAVLFQLLADMPGRAAEAEPSAATTAPMEALDRVPGSWRKGV